MKDILFMGIGGCGLNTIIRLIQSRKLSVENTCCINTDQESLAESKAGLRILAKKDNIKKVADEIRKRFLYAQKIILIAGLGGFTGSNFLPLIAQGLISYKLNVVAVAIKPFNFEGSARLETARTAVQAIQILLPKENIFVFENQLLLNAIKKLDKNISLHDAFKLMDEQIFKKLISI